MRRKLFLLISFLFLLMGSSCSKENLPEELIEEKPSVDTIVSPVDTIVSPIDTIKPMKYCEIDSLGEGYVKACLFEDGTLMTISPDSAGYLYQIEKLESGDWNREYEIFIKTDSLFYPQLVRTLEYYYVFDYSEANKVNVTTFDLENNKVDEQKISLSDIQAYSANTRADVLQITDVSLAILQLVKWYKNPTAAGTIVNIIAAYGYGEALQGNKLTSANFALAANLLGLIVSPQNPLSYLQFAVSFWIWIDTLDSVYREVFWGADGSLKIDSIVSSSTKATIYYTFHSSGNYKVGNAILTYRKFETMTEFNKIDTSVSTVRSTAKEGNNSITVNKLEIGESYSAMLTVEAPDPVWFLGGMAMACAIITKEPIAMTGDATDIGREQANVHCQFKYLPEGTYASARCGIDYWSDDSFGNYECKKNEQEQTITLSNLIPITEYKYKAYIEYAGKRWEGQERTFTTLPPDVDGTWTVLQGDLDSFTVTFNNGQCTWNHEPKYGMAQPGTYSIGTDGTINFNVTIGLGTNRFFWDIAYFSGKLNSKKNPTYITGKTIYGWSTEYSEHVYVDTTFEAYR